MVELFIPAPTVWLRTNTRGHWAPPAAATKTWRNAACVYARHARLPRVDELVIVEGWVKKKTRQRFDVDGHTPTLKACIDGLRDAGVLVEDDQHHVLGTLMLAGKPDPKRPGLWVVLRPDLARRYSDCQR